jgi:hypothetical protein
MNLTKFIANRIEDAKDKNGLQRIDSNIQINTEAKALQAYYSPNKGRIASWWEGRKSKSRSNLLIALNEEQRLVIEQAAMLERAAINDKKRRAEFQTFIAQHTVLFIELKAKAKVIKKAAKRGLDFESQIAVRSQELLDESETKKQATLLSLQIQNDSRLDLIKHEQSIEKEKLASELKLKEYKEKAEIDLKKEVQEAEERLKFDIVGEHLTRQHVVAELQNLIEIQYVKIAEIEDSTTIPTSAKQNMIDSRLRIIKMFEKQQDEAQKAALHP